MPTDVERRRVLVAARAAETPALRDLFAAEALAAWEAVEADSFEQACFTLQHTACDLLLVDEGLYCTAGPEGLGWLGGQHDVPMVFLAGCEAETMTRAYEHGAVVCLPRRITLDHPPLLAAALKRTARGSEQLRAHRRTKESLLQCRRQIDRLVNLLWRAAPIDPRSHWCTQRHVLERLREELARTDRHGGPLTVALAEVQAPEGEAEAGDPAEWMTDRITQAKRRCDVAGQYGLQGFMLLMVHTPKEGAVTCCRRLQQALEQPSEGPTGPRGPVRVSFGIASFAGVASTPQALLREAEQNLEAAKAGVNDRVVAG